MKNIEEKILMADEEIKQLQNKRKTILPHQVMLSKLIFLEKNFVHLTGLKFIGNNQTPEKTLRDLAVGGTRSFDDIRISNTKSAFSKVKGFIRIEGCSSDKFFLF